MLGEEEQTDLNCSMTMSHHHFADGGSGVWMEILRSVEMTCHSHSGPSTGPQNHVTVSDRNHPGSTLALEEHLPWAYW